MRPVIKPAPGKKYDDFQLSYALDLLHGKMTVASAADAAPATSTRTTAQQPLGTRKRPAR